MSKLNRPIPWVTPPQGAAYVDWGNPLTKGLRDLSLFNQRRNVVRNAFLSSNGTNNSDPRGPIITTDATAYSVPGGYAALPITVIIGFVRLGSPTNSNHALWISKDDITGNSGLYFRYEDAGTLAVIKSQTAAVGSGAFTVKPGGSLLALTIDSGNYALYGDGGLVASGTHAQTFTSVTPVIGSESSEALEDHPNGIFYFHAVWDRVLSAGEIKRISDNPWQLYAPRKRQIYVSAASGGISGTLSQTLGDASASSTGTVKIAGTTSSTLSAATSSATGTLAIVGSASPTLGAITSAATGTVAIVGTLSKTLDAATLAATGVLTAPGTGVVNQSLATATLSATGTVAIVGSASVNLGALGLSSASAIRINASLAQTLASATLSATGAAVGAISGTASVTLGSLTLSAAGQGLWADVARASTVWTDAADASGIWTEI